MLDIYELVSQAVVPGENFTPRKEELLLALKSKHILIRSEKGLAEENEDRDVDKVVYIGQLIDGRCVFVDDQSLTHEVKIEDYGKYWVLIPQESVIGSALAAAYDEVMAAAKSSVPHQYKDKIVIPHLTKSAPSLK